MTGRFFQIDANAWQRVASCGLNASVAYLVLACGTGHDNRTTAWSVHAIEKYTGIGRSKAKQAIEALVLIGAVTRAAGVKSVYFIEPFATFAGRERLELAGEVECPDPQWIWLPNSLVTGAGEEVTPIERVRALQDVRVLQHLIALYEIQDLAEDGGIYWRYIRRVYARSRITERGIWNIWGFRSGDDQCWLHTPVVGPFRDGPDREDSEVREGFWQSWSALVRLGLIECVPHLVEADNNEAMPIYACPAAGDGGTKVERDLGELARNCAAKLLGNPMQNRIDDYEVVLPVPDNFPAVELVGVFRLRYRPHTAKTAAWFAKSQHEAWREKLRQASDG